MFQKIVSILFAAVMLFASCTRDLRLDGQVALLVIDLCLLGLWCLFTYFEFASDWRLASIVGYTLMFASLIILFFQLNYATPSGVVAFFADVIALSFLITSLVPDGGGKPTAPPKKRVR